MSELYCLSEVCSYIKSGLFVVLRVELLNQVWLTNKDPLLAKWVANCDEVHQTRSVVIVREVISLRHLSSMSHLWKILRPNDNNIATTFTVSNADVVTNSFNARIIFFRFWIKRNEMFQECCTDVCFHVRRQSYRRNLVW